ncbi:MAG TPA: GNAT family N-acetyltransferase [Candidatus Limnocylindrales bacterium]|nr:GNAT family N-acetyltransferase [Candidatus Limnocylindrales bacterium]
MSPSTLAGEPPCPPAVGDVPSPTATSRSLRAVRRPFDTIDAGAWDACAAASPWATPFARWAFHRAWWDAYGANAHEETVVLVDASGADDAEPVAIAPLMHRHEVEPGDVELATKMRHADGPPLTPVPDDAKAVFFGASYHADYATLLCAPGDLPAAAEALAAYCASEGDPEHPRQWDAVDLRRLKCGDPAADALLAAFGRREIGEAWTVNVEREEVCPVAELPEGASIDDFLGTLGKKERHEIRRKVRRAEAVGDVALADSADPLADLEAFIDLHQKRWGVDGLFPDTPGGEQSRVFFRRLFELFGQGDALRLSFLTVGGRRIAAGVSFETPDAVLYYNAGVDPDARELSPGVIMVERYVRRALAEGKRRMDFLRGDEPYKYEWGAVDEPIQRVLVRRTEGR